MGGPRVTPKTENLIIDIWMSLRNEGIEPTAKQVLAASEAHIKKYDLKDIFLPKIRKVQNLIRDTKKRREDLPKSEQKQQKPWSMAALNDLELPPESIPHVLQVWRYSVNLGAEFTIRQAKWVSRLHAQVPDIIELWFQSLRYSREEELSLSSGNPMRIYMLDGILVMGEWEFNTTLGTDVLKPDIIRYVSHTIKPVAMDGCIAEEFLHAILKSSPWEYEDEDLDESLYKRKAELFRLITELSSSTNYFPDIESRMVYLRHLSYLSKGPKWNSLPPKEILNIIVELRKWVVDTKTKMDEPKPEEELFDFLHRDIMIQKSFPLHLYDRAGYNFLNREERK